MQKKKPILSIRPHFDPALAVVESLPATLVATVAGTAVAGTFFHILFSALGITRFIPGSVLYMSLFLMSVTLSPAVFYELKKRALKRTAYHFYDSYLEFQNFRFFINRRRGRVRYEDIADITQHASFLEGLNGLTTVYLYVPGMGYQTFGSFTGVKMTDIRENSQSASRILDMVEQKSAQTASGTLQADPVPTGPLA